MSKRNQVHSFIEDFQTEVPREKKRKFSSTNVSTKSDKRKNLIRKQKKGLNEPNTSYSYDSEKFELSDQYSYLCNINNYEELKQISIEFDNKQRSFLWKNCIECQKGFYGLDLINGICSKNCNKFFKGNFLPLIKFD